MNRRAFSLIELLIVITIIGILAVVLLPKITSGPARARDAQRIADVASIAKAIELYKLDNQAYPIRTGAALITSQFLTLGQYFDNGIIPVDPQSGNVVVTGTTNPGKYHYTSNGLRYAIFADTETDKFNTPGYYYVKGFAWPTSPPTFTVATSSDHTNEANVYVYVK